MPKGKSKYAPVLASFVDVLLLIIAFLLAKQYVFEGVVPEKSFYSLAGFGCVFLYDKILLFIIIRFHIVQINQPHLKCLKENLNTHQF